MRLVHYQTRMTLQDATTLADQKIENDEVIALCYKREGAAGTFCVPVSVRSAVHDSICLGA